MKFFLRPSAPSRTYRVTDTDLSKRTSLGPAALLRQRIAGIGFVALLLLTFIGTTPFQDLVMAIDLGNDIIKELLVAGIFILLLLGTYVPGAWWRSVALPPSLLFVFAYCLVSVTWALSPSISIRRLIETIIPAWAVFRSARVLGSRLTLIYLRNVFLVLLVISYAVVMFTPFGVHNDFMDSPDVLGAWRGIFGHKNTAGAFFGFVILFFVFDPVKSPKIMRATAIIASAFFLLMTRSKTAIIVLAIALVAGFVMRNYSPRHRFRAVLASSIAVGVALPIASLYWGDLINKLEDPNGFTGRTQIWTLLLTYAKDHLWAGAGFDLFWQIGASSPIWKITNNWVATLVGQGHNGYVDLLVTIGLGGLLLSIIVIFVLPIMQLLLDTEIRSANRGLYVSMLVFALGDNMSESSLLDRLAIPEVLLMICLALIHLSSATYSAKRQAFRSRSRTHKQDSQTA